METRHAFHMGSYVTLPRTAGMVQMNLTATITPDVTSMIFNSAVGCKSQMTIWTGRETMEAHRPGIQVRGRLLGKLLWLEGWGGDVEIAKITSGDCFHRNVSSDSSNHAVWPLTKKKTKEFGFFFSDSVSF